MKYKIYGIAILVAITCSMFFIIGGVQGAATFMAMAGILFILILLLSMLP